MRVAFVWSTNHSLLLYQHRSESNLRFHAIWKGTLVQTSTENRLASSRNNSVVMCLLIDFTYLGKITLTIKTPQNMKWMLFYG